MRAAPSQRTGGGRRSPKNDSQKSEAARGVERSQDPVEVRRRREERECAQFLRAQQKLLGKKTTEEYARIRLVHRANEKERKRHLHQNGTKKITSTNDNDDKTKRANLDRQFRMSSDEEVQCAHVLSARERLQHTNDVVKQSPPKRIRPQSAKTLREGGNRNGSDGVLGHHVSVPLLERCIYNPIPLTTHLAASRSAPRLQKTTKGVKVSVKNTRDNLVESDSSIDIAPKAIRHHIIVHMRRLEVLDDEEEDEASSINSVRRAWGDGE